MQDNPRRRASFGLIAGLALASVVFSGCDSSHGPAFNGPPVSTLAGAGNVAEVNGTGSGARFNNPANVALSPAGNLIVCDFDGNSVRQVTPAGVTTTVVSQANFIRPFGIARGSDSQMYVETDNDPGLADAQRGTIWRINLAAGTATSVGTLGGRPRGLVASPRGGGILLVADILHHVIRRFNPATGVATNLAGQADAASFVDGTAAVSRFSRPYGMAALADGTVLVADQDNSRIRRLTLSADGTTVTNVSTYAGDGTPGLANGARLTARFNRPQSLAVDNAQNVYIGDNGNFVIRRIAPNGTVSTIAGSANVQGFLDGALLTAQFYGMEGIAVTPDGSVLYVADGTGGNDGQPFNRVRRVALQ